jgi:hypothetical protein
MNRTQKILAAIIVVQVAIGVFLYWPKTPISSQGALLLGGATSDQVTSLTLENTDGTQSVFEKQADGTWLLPQADDYPADTTKITALLDKLVKIRDGRLVTETTSSQKRLQVADDAYYNKITLAFADGTSQTLYIGTSAGAGATHVRLSGQDSVYLTDQLTSYDADAAVNNWVDVEYLTTTYADINYLTFTNAEDTMEFQLDSAGTWTMSGLTGDQVFNPNNLSSMLNRLTILNLLEPLGKTEKPEYGMATPSATIYFTTHNAETGDQEITLIVGALNADKNAYYVKSSTSEYYVLVSSYNLDSFVTRTKNDFLTVHATATP